MLLQRTVSRCCFPGALWREVPGWHLTHNRTVGGLCAWDSSFHITFLTSAMISARTEMLRVIFINEEVKGPTHRLPSSRHHGIGLTHYRWSPVCLLVRLSIKPAYPWGPAVVRPSYVGARTQTQGRAAQVVCQLAWSHCTSNCGGFCDFTRHNSRASVRGRLT